MHNQNQWFCGSQSYGVTCSFAVHPLPPWMAPGKVGNAVLLTAWIVRKILIAGHTVSQERAIQMCNQKQSSPGAPGLNGLLDAGGHFCQRWRVRGHHVHMYQRFPRWLHVCEELDLVHGLQECLLILHDHTSLLICSSVQCFSTHLCDQTLSIFTGIDFHLQCVPQHAQRS